MRIRKIVSALLAAVLLFTCLPFAASAAKAPTILYVGEMNKTEDNLIAKYKRSGQVDVYEVYENTSAYYTLTEEEDVGYVLTFYNNYVMSQMVEEGSVECGLFCDGDLTVRIAGSVKFDTSDSKYREFGDAIGWMVKGTLTIEGDRKNAKVIVNGSSTMRDDDDGGIGICADTLMLHNVEVHANGGYAAVQAKSALVMADARLYADTDESMKRDGEPRFTYSIETENFIQYRGFVDADGDVDIKAYCLMDGTNEFDVPVVVYGRRYVFANEAYAGIWLQKFDLFKDPSLIPYCMSVSLTKSMVKIDNNRLTLNRRGEAAMTLSIRCGRATIVMDEVPVSCSVRWWQWIPYFLSILLNPISPLW